MQHRFAVIDLGTNTFHLLIVSSSGSGWDECYRERIFINLAEDGIDRIGPGAWQRGLDALKHFSGVISEYGTAVQAVGTAALRRATNAPDFLDAVKTQTGLEVQVISGDREAELITRGVLSAIPVKDVPMLIMDIGGGSVEMIVFDDGKAVFAESYALGVAVLYDMFHHEEPISMESLEAIDRYLEEELRHLLAVVERLPKCVLIGASGTFEVVDQAVHHSPQNRPYSVFGRNAFFPIYHEVIGMTLEQRLAHPDIPANRAQYIVSAFHLIAFILERLQSPTVYISNYALKEGLIEEWRQNFR